MYQIRRSDCLIFSLKCYAYNITQPFLLEFTRLLLYFPTKLHHLKGAISTETETKFILRDKEGMSTQFFYSSQLVCLQLSPGASEFFLFSGCYFRVIQQWKHAPNEYFLNSLLNYINVNMNSTSSSIKVVVPLQCTYRLDLKAHDRITHYLGLSFLLPHRYEQKVKRK